MNNLLRLSDRSLHAAATFGNRPDAHAHISEQTLHAIADIAANASTTLILGPSGAGKSRLLRAIASQLIFKGLCAIFINPHEHASRTTRTAVDLVPGPVAATRRLLGACGLADVRTFTRAAGLLSVGESFRLLLARAFARKPDVILIDEFGGSLDVETLESLCHTLRRANRDSKLIIAGVHPMLREMLRPDVVITCATDAPPTIEQIRGGPR